MMPLMLFLLPKLDEVWGLNDTATRSVVKTVTWRITGSTATFLIAYAMTGNFAVAGVIGVTQMISNTVLYYIHERAWSRIVWGAK
jgi:uncharacterized membrane protein